MAVEREAKIQVQSHDAVRERLEAVGGENLGTVLETNLIFDRPDGSLRVQGVGLRIRSSESAETGKCSATMTLKGPVEPGPFKSREELEIEVSDRNMAAKMLTGLGFVRVLQYEKQRESWRVGECRVELDRPPHVGLFVEIEGPSDAAIDEVRRALGLDDLPHVKRSYPAMLMAYCERHGIAECVLGLPKA